MLERNHATRTTAMLSVAVIATGLSACGNSKDVGAKAGGDSPIIVGFATAKTGDLAVSDVGGVVMAKIAFDEINKSGGLDGRKIETIEGDNQSNPNTAATVSLDLIQQGASVLIGSCDFDRAAPGATAAQSKNVLTISLCAGSAKFGPSGIGPLAFTMGTSSGNESAAAAQFAFETKGWKSAYTIADTKYDFTNGWITQFQAAFGTYAGANLAKDTFQSGSLSGAAQVTRLKAASDRDVIVICAGEGNGTLLKAIRDAGIATPILECVAGDGGFYRDAVPNLSDFYVTNFGSYVGDDENPKVNEIVKRFTSETGEAPTSSKALLGYATGLAIIRGVTKAGTTDGAKLAAALETFKSEELAAWPTTYTKTCHIAAVDRSVTIMSVTEGKPKFEARLIPKSVPGDGCQ